MQQFVLPLSHADIYHSDDFIVSSSNQAAYDKINKWRDKWGHQPYPYSLLLYGEPSSGKTYLAKIWQALSSAYIVKKNQLVQNDILKSHQAFIIEDIENWREIQLLHHFNLLNENNKYLLMTASSRSGKFQLQDLNSRINSIFKANIGFPDDELIRILLFKLFSSQSVKISEQVLDFLLMRVPRQFNELIALVNKINKYALIHKRSITVPLVREII